MDKDLKNVFPLGSPNLKMVQKVLDDNQEFVNKQKAKFLEDEKRRRRELEEAEMKANLKKA